MKFNIMNRLGEYLHSAYEYIRMLKVRILPKPLMGRSMMRGAGFFDSAFHLWQSALNILHVRAFFAASGRIVRWLSPIHIVKDIKFSAGELNSDVHETFDSEDGLLHYQQIEPKYLSLTLLSSAQHFLRVYVVGAGVVVLLATLLGYLFHNVGFASNQQWQCLAVILVTVFCVLIVLLAWWLALSLTSLLGANGLHIVAYHNVGTVKSATRGLIARDINAIISFARQCRVDNGCDHLRWLDIRARIDRVARDYAIRGFWLLIACYILGLSAFGLICAWWTWFCGDGQVVKEFCLNARGFLDLTYFLNVVVVTIGFGDTYFVGIVGKFIGIGLCVNLLINALFIITWYHTYAFTFKERLFVGMCDKAHYLEWQGRSILF